MQQPKSKRKKRQSEKAAIKGKKNENAIRKGNRKRQSVTLKVNGRARKGSNQLMVRRAPFPN